VKAIVFAKYGSADVLQLQDVEKPTPKDNEVLIQVRAAGVTAGDCELRAFKFPFLWRLPLRIMFGVLKPRVNILGYELAGDIEAVGKDVEEFKVGDPVFAATGGGFGAHAEYKCLANTRAIAMKPANMTYVEAATVPLGMDSLHFIRKARIQSGERVLVNGAAGGIGTVALQLAKHHGAEVTGVDSTDKLEVLRTLGADHVIDYTRQDFTRNGETYDVIFDVVGKAPFSRSVKSLNENGRFISAVPALWWMIRGLWISKTSSKSVMTGLASDTKEDLLFLRDLIEAGKIKAVVDRTYPLEETADAHRYIEAGHKKGNVVITLDHG
jgi:2-desacetyl-2-hydroxyethyl bacteriochlorophyllide A dehydrogenase